MQAGSLIVSAFGDAVLPRGGRIWLGSLISLLQPLGINERLIRTAAFRLVKDGWLRTEAQGRRADYALTTTGQQRFDAAARHIYAPRAPRWDGQWRLVLVVRDLEPAARDALRRALFWQGFGTVGADCFVHPSVELAAALESLRAEGLTDALAALRPLQAIGLGGPSDDFASDQDMVRRAWNLDHLASAYSGFVTTYSPVLDAVSAAAAQRIDDERAFLLRTLLIHDYRRLLLRDPQLPDELLPRDWSGQRARDICQTLYRLLLGPAERHLDAHLRLASGDAPPATTMLATRFSDAPSSDLTA